jgi:hypothetical protein
MLGNDGRLGVCVCCGSVLLKIWEDKLECEFERDGSQLLDESGFIEAWNTP